MVLADHHELISAYVLHAGVPQEIVLQFARNVYLYAWFVYRFYPVAEHQCLACLELALRERLKEEIRNRQSQGVVQIVDNDGAGFEGHDGNLSYSLCVRL